MKIPTLLKELPNAHQHFHASNSGIQKQFFYPYKAQILKRYGIPDGYDVQRVKKECWHCDGSGIDPYTPGYERPNGEWIEIYCDRCCGSGYYRDSTYYLQRYRFGDRIYHTPNQKHELVGSEHKSIQGFIEHSYSIEFPSDFSIEVCLLRWLPIQFLKLKIKLARDEWRRSNTFWHYRNHRKWIRKAWEKNDDDFSIPF